MLKTRTTSNISVTFLYCLFDVYFQVYNKKRSKSQTFRTFLVNFEFVSLRIWLSERVVTYTRIKLAASNIGGSMDLEACVSDSRALLSQAVSETSRSSKRKETQELKFELPPIPTVQFINT